MLVGTMVERRLNVLSVSTMFPSAGLPHFGVFVRYRLQQVASHCNLRVVSGVPTFPLVTRLLHRYRRRLIIGKKEIHGGGPTRIDARYPHYLSVPKVLKPLDGLTLAMAVYRECRRLAQEGFAPDVLDAHLAFPDGFASILVGTFLDIPVSITVRGHDINDMQQHAVRWWMSKFALSRADLVIGVSRALLDEAVEAGSPMERARVIPNGVDLSLFRPLNQTDCRSKLDLPLDRKIVVTVGHLIERKGFHVLVEALSLISAAERPLLLIVGGRGEETDYRPRLEKQVDRLGLGNSVRFTGAIPNRDLAPYYGAADISALASSREGWPNVLFESLACGRPVVATDVYGTSECLNQPDFGTLVTERTGTAFARALTAALWHRSWQADTMVEYAARNTWASVGEAHMEALRQAVESRGQSDQPPIEQRQPGAGSLH